MRGLGAIAGIAFFAMGWLQIAAMFTGVSRALDLGFILNFLACIFVSYVPILGTVAGIWGATTDWHWHWYWACLLFLWPYAIYVAVILGVGATALAQRSRGSLQ